MAANAGDKVLGLSDELCQGRVIFVDQDHRLNAETHVQALKDVCESQLGYIAGTWFGSQPQGTPRPLQ